MVVLKVQSHQDGLHRGGLRRDGRQLHARDPAAVLSIFLQKACFSAWRGYFVYIDRSDGIREAKMVKATKKRKIAAKTAVAYIRVSTDEQALGLEAQRQAISGWAKREGVSILQWCEDVGISGGADLEDRLGMVAALAAVRELKADVLVAHKADRIARDVYVAEVIKRELRLAGATLALVEGICGDDPFSEMAATIMDAAARLERKLIAARTKAALGVKKSHGEWVGGHPPYGFQLAPRADNDKPQLIEPCPDEQRALARMVELRKQGMGGRRIAAVLETDGFQPRGASWHPITVQRMADRAIQGD
jgi:DNA invertase Pin-like site-specific DNA recombinase